MAIDKLRRKYLPAIAMPANDKRIELFSELFIFISKGFLSAIAVAGIVAFVFTVG